MSVRDADSPGADSTPPDPSTSPGTEAARSPMMSVVSAGSGRLVRFTGAGKIHPLVFYVLRSAGGIPIGTLCGIDTPLSNENATEHSLTNPGRALFLAVGVDTAGVIRHGVDLFVQQFRTLLVIAQRALDESPGDELSRSDRIQAREIIESLSTWATMVQVRRSGGDAATPLEVPSPIRDQAVELANIARRLRHHKKEASIGRDLSATADDQPPGRRSEKVVETNVHDSAVEKVSGQPALVGGFFCGFDPTDLANRMFGPPVQTPRTGVGISGGEIPAVEENTRDQSGNAAWRTVEPAGAPLRGWADICVALGCKGTRSKTRQVKRQNQLEDGPIRVVRGRPEVDKQQLLVWMHNIEERARAAEESRASQSATAREAEERGGARQGDLGMHSEKRPNARGKAR
jgi:hypothetical protein